MKKQCVTYRESKLILDDLRKETEVITDGTDNKYETTSRGRTIKKFFYWVKFKKFENYPFFIGKLHETYGRDIEVETFYSDEDTISMHVRGYKKELR